MRGPPGFVRPFSAAVVCAGESLDTTVFTEYTHDTAVMAPFVDFTAA